MEIIINQEELHNKFPKLYYNEKNNKISGILDIECICNDEYIKEKFEIEILINKDGLPSIKEIGNKIKRNYHHIYKESNKLCLATDLEQELYLRNHTLDEWIEKFVVTYFVSYCYYQKYKVFPFGEHSHGIEGVYEFLQKYFNVNNVNIAKNMLDYICTKKYRGHLICPCGSGKRIRQCHSEMLLYFTNSQELDILKSIYSIL